MKLFKILLSFTLISFLSFLIYKKTINKNIDFKVRTVEYNNNIDESIFDDFCNHQIIEDNKDLNIIAEKRFNKSILEELDLVSLDNEEFSVIYEINYVDEEETVFLNATLICENNIEIIDNVPGLVSLNKNGEADILFSLDYELVWLSEISDNSVVEQCGWFKKILKKFTNNSVVIGSTIVKVLEPIIRPAVSIATYTVIRLLGNDKAAYYGATILDMSADINGIYHANFDCWQQYFGYTSFYDTVFDSATSMRSGKYGFDVNSDGYTDYILWAWKGNYLNLGAGAELGIYERWEYSDLIWKVNKSNAMKMTVKLDYKNKTLFDWKPTSKQWWITGFDYKTQNVRRDDLTATFTVEFSNSHWYECFKSQNENEKKWNFNNYMIPQLTL